MKSIKEMIEVAKKSEKDKDNILKKCSIINNDSRQKEVTYAS